MDDEDEYFKAEGGNHTAGEPREGVQRCVMCGGVLVDNRGAMVPAGSRGPLFFAPGPVHKLGNMTGAGHDDDLAECTPSS